MSDILFPDYDNSILGIPNSILAYYGANRHHASLPILDKRLQQCYKNVVLLILDGMGYDALNAHAPDGFLMKNCVAQLSSVYPCTTVSALTTFETGLTPIEHGWLGWSHYFEELNKCIELYTGNISGTETRATERAIVWETIGFDNLFKQIQKVDASIECCRVSPYGEYKTDTNEDICSHIETLCKKEGRKYLYCYHFQPDSDMHEQGCYSERVKADIVLFDKQIEQLSAALSDTLLIVTADHGMVDCELIGLEDYPKIWNCLIAPPSREPRSVSFFVKDECKPIFPKLWEEHFGDSFVLKTGNEAFESGYFGKGIAHNRARSFLGDYVAFSTGDIGLWFRDENGELKEFKGLHAGLRAQEMLVPLILIER